MVWPKLPYRPAWRAGIHDPSVALRPHGFQGCLGHQERALEMHGQHGVEILGRELGQRLVAQDPGIVDQDVDPAEAVQRGLHHSGRALGRRDRVAVRYSLSARRGDLTRGAPSRAAVGAAAGDRSAEVVHHDASAAGGEQPGMLKSEAAAGAGHYGHLALEPLLAHAAPPNRMNNARWPRQPLTS